MKDFINIEVLQFQVILLDTKQVPHIIIKSEFLTYLALFIQFLKCICTKTQILGILHFQQNCIIASGVRKNLWRRGPKLLSRRLTRFFTDFYTNLKNSYI